MNSESKQCPSCGGLGKTTGRKGHEYVTLICEECEGTGHVLAEDRRPPEGDHPRVPQLARRSLPALAKYQRAIAEAIGSAQRFEEEAWLHGEMTDHWQDIDETIKTLRRLRDMALTFTQ